MHLLDTNVLSALMQQRADPAVVQWLDRQDPGSIWTSSITVFEIRLGLAKLADGQRRSRLQDAFDALLRGELEGRVVVFDADAAQQAAELCAQREREGNPVDLRDTLIAGCALARRMTVVTRNVRHFQGLDVPVIDPWTTP